MAYKAAITNTVDALDAAVAAQLGDASPSATTNGYSTATDTTTTTTAPDTPAAPSAPAPTSTVMPSQRALNRAFDELDSDDFTAEGYPRRTELLIILAEHDEPPVDKETAEAAYDHYVHERAARGADYSSPRRTSKHSSARTTEHEGRKPTEAAIREAVEALDDDDFGEHGQPLAAAVNEQLRRKGYGHATAAHISEAVESDEHGERRRESGRKASRNAIREGIEALDEDDFTERGQPRTAAVNEQLARHGYGRVTADQIQEAAEGWETGERRESRESHERTSGRERESARKPTKRAIREAAERVDEDDWTRSGYPRADALNQQLERMGYGPASAAEIREATERTR
jgi:hypothetical protein